MKHVLKKHPREMEGRRLCILCGDTPKGRKEVLTSASFHLLPPLRGCSLFDGILGINLVEHRVVERKQVWREHGLRFYMRISEQAKPGRP